MIYHHLRFKVITVSFVLLLASCMSNNEPGPNNNSNALSNDEKVLLAEAYLAPDYIYRSSFDLIGLAIDAVYYASITSGTGQLTTTGTLTMDSQGNLSYDTSPGNQLVINQLSETVTFTFHEFNSNITQGDLRDNMRRSHMLSFDASKEGEYEVGIMSNLNNDLRELLLDGEVEINDKAYTIDLEANGDYLFNVDNTGSELLINDQYAGTISCQDWEAQVFETWYYNNVYSSSAGVNAENATRSFNNSYTINNVSYAFEDGRIQTVFRDGRPNEYDVANPPWAAEGRLLKENEEIGELNWNVENPFIKVFLQTGEENIEMQKWRIQ